jgi:hypothetical protein
MSIDQFTTYLIEGLTEWRAAPDWQQWFSVVVLVCSALGATVAVRRWAVGVHDAYIQEKKRAEAHQARQQAVIDRQGEELARLARFDPDTLHAELARERGISRDDRNHGKVAAAAERYVEAVRPALAEAWPVIAEARLARFEDGAEALAEARVAAMGSLAAEPGDRDRQNLLDEIEALLRVEAAEPETRAQLREREERARLRRLLAEAAGDARALHDVANAEVEASRYHTAIVLLERAERALLEAGVPGGGRADLLRLRRALGEVNVHASRYTAAREILAPLPKALAAELGPHHRATLLARGELARLDLHRGRLRAALPALEAVLADMVAHLGETDPAALVTAQDVASAETEPGHLDRARERLERLLPSTIEASGEGSHNVCGHRGTLATVYLESGDAAGAREVLAPIGGGGPFLGGWIADLEGRVEDAARLLAEARQAVAALPEDSIVRKQLERYCATRRADGTGGTMRWMLDLPENREPGAPAGDPELSQLG